MILGDSLFTMQNTTGNESFTDWASAYSSRLPQNADSAVIAAIFCSVFSVMSILLVLLLCKVWSLRRAVAPVSLQMNLAADPEFEHGTRKQNTAQGYV